MNPILKWCLIMLGVYVMCYLAIVTIAYTPKILYTFDTMQADDQSVDQ